MKKTTLLFILIVLSVSAYAQTPLRQKTKAAPSSTPVQLKPLQPSVETKSEPPSPPPVEKQTASTSDYTPVYALTAARVRIRTGNDNKEFPSKVYVNLLAKSVPDNWRNYIQWNLTNEMRINSETEFGLELQGPPISLEAFQASGLKMTIKYEPNFFADAWKIENISVVLEFKDQNGNLHPALGSKTIVFSNAYGFLNNEFRNIDCFTDGSFIPVTSVIRK